MPEIESASNAYDAAEGAHCLVLCTEWDEFLDLDLERLKGTMAYPVVVDGRNVFDTDEMRAAGFAYYAAGRPAIAEESVPPDRKNPRG